MHRFWLYSSSRAWLELSAKALDSLSLSGFVTHGIYNIHRNDGTSEVFAGRRDRKKNILLGIKKQRKEKG